MNKTKCWEIRQCGREHGGANVEELGICPAYIAYQANDILEENNRRICCWNVAGTSCDRKPHGASTEKIMTCKECEFYKLMH